MTNPRESETFSTDVAIIGAGPVGLFAVFQCGMLGMQCRLIDALEENDDVGDIHSNFDIDAEVLERIAG